MPPEVVLGDQHPHHLAGRQDAMLTAGDLRIVDPHDHRRIPEDRSGPEHQRDIILQAPGTDRLRHKTTYPRAVEDPKDSPDFSVER